MRNVQTPEYEYFSEDESDSSSDYSDISRDEDFMYDQLEPPPERTAFAPQVAQQRLRNFRKAMQLLNLNNNLLFTVSKTEDRQEAREENSATAQAIHRYSEKELFARQYIQHVQDLQDMHFKALQCDYQFEDIPLWLDARIIPESIKAQVMPVLNKFYIAMTNALRRLVNNWSLLSLPFDQSKLALHKKLLKRAEARVHLMERALQSYRSRIVHLERDCACQVIQAGYRTHLENRHFYTKHIRLGYRDRGLLPGLFNTIKAQSVLEETNGGLRLHCLKRE